jgi:hypothetical protein
VEQLQSKDFRSEFGYRLGTVSLKKVKKRSKGLQMLSARRHCFLSRDSNNCEEFRRGQEKQSDGFESAAYANFATPAASCPLFVAYGDWFLE